MKEFRLNITITVEDTITFEDIKKALSKTSKLNFGKQTNDLIDINNFVYIEEITKLYEKDVPNW